MKFFIGLHQPSDARHFASACISVHRLRHRQWFAVQEWMMDSGAFTTLHTYGGYPQSVAVYAAEIQRWRTTGQLLAAVTQDYLCEPAMLARTGGTVAEHQRLTIARYDALLAHDTGVYIMPVLQGYHPAEYACHVQQYGVRLAPDAWVGVGSVCQRQGMPKAIARVLDAIHAVRPDLRLHGFGVKCTALCSPLVRAHLWSADSMAWSYHARKNGRNANDWREAQAFVHAITRRQQPVWQDLPLFAGASG